MMDSRGQSDRGVRHRFVGDLAQKVRDTVQPGFPFIHRMDKPTRSLRDASALEHELLGIGIVLPAGARFEVHRAEFPLLQGILNACIEAEFLLGVCDREPVFDELNSGAHKHLLKLRYIIEKLSVFLDGAEAHDPLDAGAVIPTAVEENDLARRREVRDIALEIPLRPLTAVRRRQSGHAADARVHPLGNAFYDSAFAGCIAAFENDDDLFSGFDDPVLELHQLALEAEQLAEIGLAKCLVGCLGLRIACPGADCLLQFEFLVQIVEDLSADSVVKVVLFFWHDGISFLTLRAVHNLLLVNFS